MILGIPSLMAARGGAGSALGPIFTRAITIDHAQVPSTQTDFPVTFNFTDTTFKTVANGGHVQNFNGYDIGFFSDSAGATPLKWDMDRYTATSGEVIVHVKIGSVSSTSDTVFYIRYGNPTIVTDQSDPTNVWTNNFRGVWHLKDGTTLTLTESTSGAFTLTNNAGVTAATGQIDGAAGFAAASSQYLSNASIGIGTSATFSAWFKATTFAQNFAGLMCMRGATGYFLINISNSGFTSWEINANADINLSSTQQLSTGTWYYLTLTYDSSAGLKAYVNATRSGGTGTANGNINTDPTTINIGRDPFGTRYTDGVIDEPRMANVARSADWITCEYNNQKAGSTFLTLGAES